MQAILFACLAIASCVIAAPRENGFSSSMGFSGSFGPGRPFPSSFRSRARSGFGPFVPFPVPFISIMPLPWDWPASKEDVEEMYEQMRKNVPWHMGPNVCNITKCFETPNSDEMMKAMKEMEGESSDDSDFFGGFFGVSAESSEECCKGECGNYTCWERKMSRTGMTTKRINYFCCEGFELAKDPETDLWLPGCHECSQSENEDDSQIPFNEEKPEDATDSFSDSDWKNRMEYSFLTHGDSHSYATSGADDSASQ